MDSIFSLSMTIFLIFVLAALSFFFSASETAVIALSKIRLRHLLNQGVKHAQNIQRLIIKLDKFIAAILIGNDFVNIAISAIITGIFVQLLGYHLGVIIATFISTFFVLIMCEITPKILATKHTEKIALFTAPAMEFFIKLFHPLIIIFTGASSIILRTLRIKPTKRSPLITEEEIRIMIEIGKEEGVLSDEERKMLYRIFEFGDTKVIDVMVSKEKIIAVDINSSSEELLNLFVEVGHSRIPVYSGSIDNIIGIVFARDLIYTIRDKGLFVLQDLIQPAYTVSSSMRVNELLRRFQTEKIQIAVVIDKEKNTLGLVTLEDLIEEIVGELEEEHKKRRSKK
ncbi:MAG: hemolysin family protein [Candidatus Omnitrophica bacterium]|nr:hemolysin family protein [Candidatus Omnitrophota bacterium]